MEVERESMDYDVVVVGAGPSGLSTAIKLKQLNPEINVCILEKGSEVGAHILSGNVFETRALDELIPDYFSFITLVLIGESLLLQSGMNSSSALVSKTLPLKIWAPTSEPFSNTQTLISGFSCFSLIAVERPDGPAPTTTTS